MTTALHFEPDERGLVRACPQCGRRNRLVYERLGRNFRCNQCHTELPQPAEPIDARDVPNFDAVIRKSALPVLVDFWAAWCGPCKMLAPEVAKVATHGAGRWIVIKVDTEEVPELASRFGIRAIPTLAVLEIEQRQQRERVGIMTWVPAVAVATFVMQGFHVEGSGTDANSSGIRV